MILKDHIYLHYYCLVLLFPDKFYWLAVMFDSPKQK